MNYVSLALKLLWRDIRSGEINILVLALMIAVTSSTSISLFGDRLHRTMATQAAEFLAADLVIASPTEIATEWQKKASELGLTDARTTEFSTVLIENDELLLSGVKAVSARYPLRGQLKTTTSDYQQETRQSNGPNSGTAWVDSRILSALKLTLGDHLTVGEKTLKITQIITYEPDKRGDLYSLSPRVMIHQDDLNATQVLQPGSHVHYFFQFKGTEEALKRFSSWVKPQLNASQRLMDIHEDRPELGSALNRAERYLGISSIIVILIAGTAIAISTNRYSERHFNATAIIRCLGCKQSEIVRLYLYQFLALGILTCSLGVFFGGLAQEMLFILLRDLLPQSIADPSWIAVLIGFMSGMSILIGFALPPLLRLKAVSPLRVLRRNLSPMPSQGWLVYGLALLLVAGLIWRYTLDFKLTAVILGGGLIVVTIAALIVHGLLWPCQKILPSLALPYRLALDSLLRHRQTTATQILAFSLTLMAMLISFSVRNDLISDWQQQLPEQAPNHFVLNVFPDQVDALTTMLQDKNIVSSTFYPVVRGRLVAINQIPVQQVVSKESQGERATHRDLSLTWTSVLPADNQTVAGDWHPERNGEVSIEQKLAQNLNVNIGDELTFTVGSQQLSVKVSHIRSLRWDTMKPNFYMIFSGETLKPFPTTYIASFYLPEQHKNYLNELVKRFPSITILEVDLILKQFQSILKQLTQAVHYLLYFALLAGFTVLFASVYASLDTRIYEATLMRTLGARKALLQRSQVTEFALLGLFSGLLAVGMSETILFVLYRYVLHMNFNLNGVIILIIPVASMIGIGLIGHYSLRKVNNQAAMDVLRDI
jgi:putative ABC transport system permease protein